MNIPTAEEAKQRAANYMSLKGALEPKQETPESMIQEIATHLGKTIPETLEHIEKFSKDLDKLKKEPKQEQDDSYIKEQKERRRKLLNLINKLEEENKFMKTELEEAAEKYAKQFDYAEDSSPPIDFVEGAKWQQERMFSKVIEFTEWIRNNPYVWNYPDKLNDTRTTEELFEQFKKK